MITILKSPFQKYTHVLQIADIHIRLQKRHDEYKLIFNRLYDEIKKTPSTTAVCLVGDVFHSKSDLSPECIQMASDLFKNIADIRPLILVAGNHDATLSNKSRLDSLTPLVDSLNHANLFYLKTTGLYGFGNILFNNMCVFDSPERYILGKDIPNIYRNEYEHIIALFHGPVDRAALDSGYAISNPAILPPLFDYHDIAMLGDIHKKQDMQEYAPDDHKPCIHYVGSMIQQNHGETLKNHGYSLWDLSTRTYQFHELENEYGYFTIDIHKGQLATDISDIPKKVRLRAKCLESIASEVKKIVAEIKSKVQVVETAYVRLDQERDKKDIISLCKDIVLTDLTNVEYQNRLINDFITKKLQLSNLQKIEDILAINRNTNLLIKKDDFIRNLKWKPIRFEFDNMFAYGENNTIDFTQMDGVYGIFGPNKSGKSSILSAIIFCLFDKFDRGFKGSFVLNSQRTSFKCKLEFEISGVRYFIERTGTTTRSGNVKVEVRFWKVVNGVEEELHGTERRDTNDIIRDYVGSYEDFILTAASFQNVKNNSSFIDMGNSERKDTLVQFIGLNIFDRLHESANEKAKELTAALKIHKDKNYQLEIQQNRSALNTTNDLFTELNAQVESLKKQISEVNEQIVMETSNLIKLDANIPTNLEQLKSRKVASEDILTQKRKFISEAKEKFAEAEKELTKINAEIDKIEKSNFVESHKIYKELADKINILKQKIDLKKVEVKGKIEKAERLKTHKYNPNCEFCVDNPFVRDANKAKKELIKDKEDTDLMLKDLEKLRSEFTKYQWVEKSYETYTKLLSKRGDIKDVCATCNKNIIITTNELERLDTSYKHVVQQIELYHRNEMSVEANAKIQSKIAAFRNTLIKLDNDHQKTNRSLMELSAKRGQYQSDIERLTSTIEEIEIMEYELDSYKTYLSAVGRDGIPYQVICNTVPEIEREVNAILSQVVDYTIQFETDGKNVIPYMVYDYGKWPIELSSGYERFVASIAIRVALTEISSLPKFSGLFLDEGMGALDSENLSMMATLFNILKNYYDFIIVISHLDSIRDTVDNSIEITHNGNLSNIIYE